MWAELNKRKERRANSAHDDASQWLVLKIVLPYKYLASPSKIGFSTPQLEYKREPSIVNTNCQRDMNIHTFLPWRP